MTEAELRTELRHANEGLAQMQELGAGYFEDEKNEQPHERVVLEQDVRQQVEQITRLENKLNKL